MSSGTEHRDGQTVRAPVFPGSRVIKLVRFPVFPGSQLIKLVRFPVFPGSQVIKVVRFPFFSRLPGYQNGSFPNMLMILSCPDWISI